MSVLTRVYRGACSCEHVCLRSGLLGFESDYIRKRRCEEVWAIVGEDSIEQFNHQRTKTKTIESGSGCVLTLGATLQRYHLLGADGGHAEEIFRKTQEVFEGSTLRWPDRCNKKSILQFMDGLTELLRSARRVAVPGDGDRQPNFSFSWSGGKTMNSLYNVQCLLRIFVVVFEKFDFDTVASISFEDWLKYLPDQKNHCAELGKKTYGSISAEFAPLSPAEVCAWACLLYSKDKTQLKAMAAAEPNTVWDKFVASAAVSPAASSRDDDHFSPCPSEFFGLALSERLED